MKTIPDVLTGLQILQSITVVKQLEFAARNQESEATPQLPRDLKLPLLISVPSLLTDRKLSALLRSRIIRTSHGRALGALNHN